MADYCECCGAKTGYFGGFNVHIGEKELNLCDSCMMQARSVTEENVEEKRAEKIAEIKERNPRLYKELIREFQPDEAPEEGSEKWLGEVEKAEDVYQERVRRDIKSKESCGRAIQIIGAIIAVLIGAAALIIPFATACFSYSHLVGIGCGILFGGLFAAVIIGFLFHGFGELLINVSAIMKKMYE